MKRFNCRLVLFTQIATALMLCQSVLFAGVGRHVAVSGGVASGNALTLGAAWTWQWAISASNTVLQPGDTVWVHVGRYMVDKDNGDIPRRAGNASFPIIYRAMPGEHVELYSNRTPPWSPLQVEAAYTWWWGFDIYQTDVVAMKEAPAIGVNADNVKFINCTVHDAMSINITDYAFQGTEVTGCIIYYGGRQTNICQHGYGGYIQNKAPSARKIYRHNDVFSNWDCGQQFYGSDATAMNNINIDSNRYWNNGNLQGKLGGEQFQPNVVIGAGEATAAVVTGINFRGNLGYYSASPGGGNEFSMGYHGSGISGWNVSRNIMVSRSGSGFHFPEGYGGSTIANNIVVGPTQSVVTGNPGQGNVGYASFAAAAAARTDDIIIYRNPYEPKRASVTVFNWDGSATVSFDPSSILRSGDAYEVRSATNFWNNILASGTWTSGNITITCANMTMATPYGIPGSEPATSQCGQAGAPFHNPVNPQPYFMPMVLVGPYSTAPPQAPAPTGTFSSSAASLPAGGGPVTLTWTSQNATEASIDQGIGTVTLSGSRTVQVTASRTFTLTLTGPGGTARYSATVQVGSPVLVPSGSFSARPDTLPVGGGSVTLTWTSQNATSASVDQGIGTVALSGTRSVSVTATRTFTLTLTGTGGTASYTARVVVRSATPPPSGSLTVSQDTLPAGGGTVTLTWTSQNATTATVDQGIGTVTLNGTRSVPVTATRTFTVTLTGAGGTASYSARVVVRSTIAPPTGWFTVSPDTLPPGGGMVTLSWTSQNATTATIDQGIGNAPLSGSSTVLITATRTFTLSLTGPGGVVTYRDRVGVPANPPVSIPRELVLEQNYPNPFNPSTRIQVNVPTSAYVKLIVRDVLGNEVARLLDGPIAAGRYSVEFSGKGLSSGVYFYTLEMNDLVEVKKMVLLR